MLLYLTLVQLLVYARAVVVFFLLNLRDIFGRYRQGLDTQMATVSYRLSLRILDNLLEVRDLVLRKFALAHLFLYHKLRIDGLSKRDQVVKVLRNLLFVKLLVAFRHFTWARKDG